MRTYEESVKKASEMYAKVEYEEEQNARRANLRRDADCHQYYWQNKFYGMLDMIEYIYDVKSDKLMKDVKRMAG